MGKSITSLKKSSASSTYKLPKSIYKVGDAVKFRFGVTDAYGHIIEDRGAIGVGGRRLWRVRYDWDDTLREIELPEEELQAIALP